MRRRLPHIFYGWWLLAGGFVATALVGAATSYGTSLFLVPLTAEFGWTRTSLAAALSLARVQTGLADPINGTLTDRFGPRRMVIAGTIVAAVGFMLLGRVDTLAEAAGLDPLIVFYFIYVVLVALGASTAGSTPVTTAVANWFRRRRGLALGILSSGHAFGAAVWVPVLGFIIGSAGWREAVTIEGIAIAAVGIPAALLLRHRPEQYGLLPDGDAPGRTQDSGPRTESAPPPTAERPLPTKSLVLSPESLPAEPAYTVRQAAGTSAFWCLAFAFAFRVSITNAVQVHLAALLQDIGMSALEAAGVLSALAALSIVGRFGMGFLGDMLDRRRVYLGGLLLLVLGLWVLAGAREPWQVVPFLILYAPAYGGLASLASALRADYFGRRSYGAISGAMSPVTTLGTIIGPLFAGYVFDVTGTYQGAMTVFTICGAASLVMMFLARRPADEGSKEVGSREVRKLGS